MTYIAHIRESDESIQTLKEHLLQTGELASIYGKKIGTENLSRLAGILHDIGKISKKFQRYIKDAHDNPDNPPKRGSVDHSTLGGKILYNLYGENHKDIVTLMTIEIVSNVIVSHHGYLQDYISPNLESKFLKRVIEKNSEEIVKSYDEAISYLYENILSKNRLDRLVELATQDVKDFIKSINNRVPPEKRDSQMMFLIKAVFSTLIDADRTNTRQFVENNYIETEYNSKELFSDYYEKLMNRIVKFENKEDANQIDILRNEMSKQCDQFAKNEPGIYTLSIPTGGGKTFASLRYALKHAQVFNKDRILYILPYTTIIEQNADEVRKITEDPINLLEHHSNIIQETTDEESVTEDEMDIKSRLQLVKDNWDVPLVFSTMVQFLNIFYDNGTRSIRRMNKLANSVIIFDEVQKLPTHTISLFNEAVNFLKEQFNCTILLCTATQPSLENVTNGIKLNVNHEIISDIDEVSNKFKRVEIIDKVTSGQINTLQLTQFILEQTSKVNSQLIILNTKSVVKKLYESIKEADSRLNLYHLSTTMAPAHRKEVLNDIRDDLNNNIPIICISTQLIEAGVDISFESVIRSLTGIDSIAQASGRCNRNGERDLGEVYIIDHSEENTEKLLDIETGKSITRKLLFSMRNDEELYDGNLLSRQAMKFYFDNFYYERKAVLDHPNKNLPLTQVDLLMSHRRRNSLVTEYKSKYNKVLPLVNSTSMHTAAKEFYVIENNTTTVLVPYGSGKDIITDLHGEQSLFEMYESLKGAQQYSIEIYDNEKRILEQNGGIKSALDGQVFILEPNYYDEYVGLNLQGDSQLESLLF